jgi:hypothetical protein
MSELIVEERVVEERVEDPVAMKTKRGIREIVVMEFGFLSFDTVRR